MYRGEAVRTGVIKPQAIVLDQAEEHLTELLNNPDDRGYADLTLSEEYGGMCECNLNSRSSRRDCLL